MLTKRYFVIAVAMAAAGMAFLAGRSAGIAAMKAEAANRVFEIRTYTAEDGKLDALLARFRDHTCGLFEKHGMTSIGYWVPQDEPRSKNTLVYILAHPSRDAARKNWSEFSRDPEWQKVKSDSEADGKLTTKTESLFVDPTDFSPLK
ncbi:MAG TPA: NIPSNAP family protein [Pirellulales bacterium]|nr:NIPSNAP family protein [Pirellulales bacterium]